MLSENDRVIALVEKEGFPKGSVGVIVSKYALAEVYEVELWDSMNYPVDVVAYKTEELQRVEAK